MYFPVFQWNLTLQTLYTAKACKWELVHREIPVKNLYFPCKGLQCTYDVTNHIKGKVIKERFKKDFSVQNIFLFTKGIFFLFNTHDLHHFSVYCFGKKRALYNLQPLYFRHACEAKKNYLGSFFLQGVPHIRGFHYRGSHYRHFCGLRDHSSTMSSKRWVVGVRKWQFLMIYSTVNHQRVG